MIFAGIDVNIITHEKALAAGVDAFGLWAWGMCYAQLHETDGRLPRVAVLLALGGRRNIMLAKRLVEVGLWTENEDGSWCIWNYAKKNQTAEEIRAKKNQAAERAKRWRDRSRNASSNADVTRYVPITDSVTQRVRTDPPPEPSPPPDNTTRHQGGEIAPARGVVRLDLEITEDVERVWEQRTMTKTAGKPIADVWANFLGHFASQDFRTRDGLLGRWSKWIDKQCDIAASERQAEYDRKDRLNRQRTGPPSPAENTKLTDAEQRRFAEQLRQRMQRKGAA